MPKARARVQAHLNGWLVLTDCQLTVSTSSRFAPSDVFELILLPFHKTVIGELPSVRICLAKPLQSAEKECWVHRSEKIAYREKGADTYICVELPDKAGEVVVLERPGQKISGELSWLPNNETATCK